MSRLALFALLALVAAVCAQDFPVVGEPSAYPGSSVIKPQNQGGSLQTAGPFGATQTTLSGIQYGFPGYTQVVTANQVPALGGAFRGQVIGAGVDPIRGVFRTARNGFGHSSASATGRSGHGAASGDGFFFADTKYPERQGLGADQFIEKGRLPEQLDTANSASAVVAPVLLVLAVVALLF
jgi:hypothetical protein